MCENETPITHHVFAAASQSVSPEVRRAHAVAAVMELLAVRARHAADFELDKEIKSLDGYANLIQESLVYAR